MLSEEEKKFFWTLCIVAIPMITIILLGFAFLPTIIKGFLEVAKYLQ